MTFMLVSSSVIRSIGYDGATLIIKFNSGRVYEYHRVPYSVYAALVSAYSIGAYYNHYIRGRYR
jgi:hypothetical protein